MRRTPEDALTNGGQLSYYNAEASAEPLWRRRAFWFLFGNGAFWGAVLAPTILQLRELPWIPHTVLGRVLRLIINAFAGGSRTPLANVLFVCGFTLVAALGTAYVGSLWLRRREAHFWVDRMTRELSRND
jgi:hypothetical protein